MYELRHNPYFSRWFSAMYKNMYIVTKNPSHNPYFSRWFSAIEKADQML